ncbi:unnamed protein product, partial [Closterium sp. NIES-53]
SPVQQHVQLANQHVLPLQHATSSSTLCRSQSGVPAASAPLPAPLSAPQAKHSASASSSPILRSSSSPLSRTGVSALGTRRRQVRPVRLFGSGEERSATANESASLEEPHLDEISQLLQKFSIGASKDEGHTN